ncbi:MAG: DUF962 domain-containing protein [Planctomycetes bacterium]|nr:DUF962 domain-containing protein [Planctomycetota bacterium]
MSDPEPYPTLRAFWPYYLSEHRHPVNRALHAVGSLCGLTWLGLAIAWRQPTLVAAALVSGYAFAWIGHFVVERNRPATFRYPLKSFLCDWLLLVYTLTGRAGGELARLEAEGRLPRKQEPQAVS